MDLNIFFPEKDLISYRGGIDKDISWNLNFKNEINDWNFERGSLVLGAKDYSDSNSRGLHIRGETKYFDFEEWEQPSESSNKKQDNLYKNTIRSADVRVGNLMIFGRSFPNQRIIVNKGSTDWIIETEGEKATQLEISSTDIRTLVRSGRNPRFLTPASVTKIINDSKCYKNKLTN